MRWRCKVGRGERVVRRLAFTERDSLSLYTFTLLLPSRVMAVLVMLVTAIHVFCVCHRAWMAGTRPYIRDSLLSI